MNSLYLKTLVGFALLSVALLVHADDNGDSNLVSLHAKMELESVYAKYGDEVKGISYETFSNKFDEVQEGKPGAFEFFAAKGIDDVLIYAFERTDISAQRTAVLSSEPFLDQWSIPVLVAVARASDSWNFQRGEEVVAADKTRAKAIALLAEKTGIKAPLDLQNGALLNRFLSDCLNTKTDSP